MAANPTGQVAISLNGVLLASNPMNLSIIERDHKEVRQMASGKHREVRAWWGPTMLTETSAIFPSRRPRYEISLDYNVLNESVSGSLEELLATAGPHQVTIWKTVTLAWQGDGSKNEFYVPWQLANHIETTLAPRVASSGETDPVVKVGINGSTLTYSAKDAGTYSGSVTAGEVWWLDNGQKFKLETAPSTSQVVYARFFPTLSMLERPQIDRGADGQAPFRERRKVQLVEAVG